MNITNSGDCCVVYELINTKHVYTYIQHLHIAVLKNNLHLKLIYRNNEDIFSMIVHIQMRLKYDSIEN